MKTSNDINKVTAKPILKAVILPYQGEKNMKLNCRKNSLYL